MPFFLSIIAKITHMTKVNFPQMKKVSALMVDTESGEILYRCSKELPVHDGTDLYLKYVQKLCDSLLRGLKQKNLCINIQVEDCKYQQPFLF